MTWKEGDQGRSLGCVHSGHVCNGIVSSLLERSAPGRGKAGPGSRTSVQAGTLPEREKRREERKRLGS